MSTNYLMKENRQRIMGHIKCLFTLAIILVSFIAPSLQHQMQQQQQQQGFQSQSQTQNVDPAMSGPMPVAPVVTSSGMAQAAPGEYLNHLL